MNQFESIYISSESENEDKSSDSDYEWKDIDIVIDNTGVCSACKNYIIKKLRKKS